MPSWPNAIVYAAVLTWIESRCRPNPCNVRQLAPLDKPVKAGRASPAHGTIVLSGVVIIAITIFTERKVPAEPPVHIVRASNIYAWVIDAWPLTIPEPFGWDCGVEHCDLDANCDPELEMRWAQIWGTKRTLDSILPGVSSLPRSTVLPCQHHNARFVSVRKLRRLHDPPTV
jgi:hypothetical protein